MDVYYCLLITVFNVFLVAFNPVNATFQKFIHKKLDEPSAKIS